MPPPPAATATAESISLRAKAAATPRDVVERKTLPVRFWAGIGAIVLAFEAYVLIKWVTGPYFTSVDPGPSEAPGWMIFSLRAMEIGFVALWAWCVWHFFIQPYRREARFSFDGLLCMALFVFAFFQDPLANYGGAVFTYNAELVNFGSWLNDVPGAVTPGQPGAQLPETVWTAAVYPGVIFVATILGCWFMRKVKERFPAMGKLGLIGTVFVFMVAFDIVLEGFILMPLGAYTYAGAPDWASINDSHYYKYTLVEGLGFGAVWTSWASLRYFRDDKGHSIVERGIEKVRGSELRKGGLRFLAIGGFVAVTMAVCVNIPFFWMSTHMSEYPADVQKRSYLTNGLCGEDTTLACFGPSVPNTRGNDAIRIGPNGERVVPAGTELPRVVPIDRGPLGPEGD